MADFNYSQNFDSLTDGEIVTQDSWESTSGSSARFIIQTTVKKAGAKALEILSNITVAVIARTVNTFSSGHIYFAFRISDNEKIQPSVFFPY